LTWIPIQRAQPILLLGESWFAQSRQVLFLQRLRLNKIRLLLLQVPTTVLWFHRSVTLQRVVSSNKFWLNNRETDHEKTKLIAALALTLSATSAFAYDNTVKAGLIGLWIHSDSPDFTTDRLI
jgi:hypothetical protein